MCDRDISKTSRWQFFDKEFEYERIIDPMWTAWYGHVFFAYDLVRNLRPARIVELGTARGHSFFSFCQAVKDGNLDTELFAVDTWEGDRHEGFYDNSVWDVVNQVKETLYSTLQINLLRKTFDQAADDLEEKSIDILHIDGCHTYEAVKNDFERWVGKVKDNGIILFHDITEMRDDFGVFKFWEELKKLYKTIEFCHSHGLGVLCKNTQSFLEFFKYNDIWQKYYLLKMGNKLMILEREKKNAEMQQKELEISNLKIEIQQKELEIQQKVHEIDSMKSTKFWKLRTFCVKVWKFGLS